MEYKVTGILRPNPETNTTLLRGPAFVAYCVYETLLAVLEDAEKQTRGRHHLVEVPDAFTPD